MSIVNNTHPASSGEPAKRPKHPKCAVFDTLTNWEDVITSHEAEDPDGESLAQFIDTAAGEISKENMNTENQNNAENQNNVKTKKSKKKKVKFNQTVVAASNVNREIPTSQLSQSFTGGAGTALSNMNISDTSDSVTESTSSLQSAKDKIGKLKGKLQKKLDASQFRFINEKLYTTSGVEAMVMFEKKPELFDVYHRGFASQVCD